MKIGVLFVAMFALLFTACPSNSAPKTAQKKATAERSYKALNAINFASLLSNKPRIQTEKPLTCTSGSGSADVTGNDAGTSFSIKINATSCVSGDTTLSTGASGFTLTASVTGDGATATYTLGLNGALTINAPEGNGTVTYNNLTMTISGSSSSLTLTINGSVTVDGDTVSFNNETYTQADFQ